MTGRVDEFGRALITIRLRPSPRGKTTVMDAWIDTGFTGDLVLSRATIHRANLRSLKPVTAILADGAATSMPSSLGYVEWFGVWRAVEVVENAGRMPLLGVSLLAGRRLTIDYAKSTLELE
jgi:clan AA aspartic protease